MAIAGLKTVRILPYNQAQQALSRGIKLVNVGLIPNPGGSPVDQTGLPQLGNFPTDMDVATDLVGGTDFTVSGTWPPSNMTATLNGAAPSGAKAYTLANTTTGGCDFTSSLGTAAAGQKYALSLVAKRINSNWVVISGNNESTANFAAWFNLATGKVDQTSVAGSGVVDGVSMVSLGGGWYDCVLFGHFTGGTSMAYDLRVPSAAGLFAGNNGASVLASSPYGAAYNPQANLTTIYVPGYSGPS